MDECLDLTMLCDSKGLDVPSVTLSGPAASGALSSAPATVISNMPSTNAPADASTIVPAQPTDSPAQSTNAPTQSTDSPAQSANTTTSSAEQSCLIPHLLHVQVSVVLLGGLIHLALWNAIILLLFPPSFSVWMTITCRLVMIIYLCFFPQMVPLCKQTTNAGSLSPGGVLVRIRLPLVCEWQYAYIYVCVCVCAPNGTVLQLVLR